ncbi:LamG domain-containing protein [Mangrovivirga sp. M17]|uniref:LamG domain-containing protein n=1 Tax=Mangrovivirga halotolerans TaxID=2993936 RepID=A0ABT3RMS7_9BACT|nr:LamG domain-containing protein [Mangrovivirga halotolerans]MCX2742674.1 LamG domain-containing protein [Mangrovivirga halotolerans]
MRFNQLSQGLLALVFISVFSFITSCSDEEGTEPKNEEPEVIDIPRDGLVAFYPMNGNMNDESGVGDSANGGFYGTPKPAELTADRYGNLNSAYKIETTNNLNTFQGTSDKFTYVGDVSYGIWLKSLTSGTILRNNFELRIWYDKESSMFLADNHTSYESDDLKISISNPGDWHFLSITWDNSNGILKFYLDGELVGQNNGNTSSYKNGGPNIGEDGFSGALDDFTIYKKALTDSEVKELYQQTFTK